MSTPARLRALVADDQPDVRAALELLLKGEGYHVDSVGSPKAVVEALQNGSYDVLLMDLNYSRDTTSGQEVARAGHRFAHSYPGHDRLANGRGRR